MPSQRTPSAGACLSPILRKKALARFRIRNKAAIMTSVTINRSDCSAGMNTLKEGLSSHAR